MNPVITTNSIRSLPKDQWDDMAENNAFAGYGWLITVEEIFSKQITPIYFAVQESENIVGAAVCYLVPKNVKIVSSDDLLLGRLKKAAHLLGISFSPAMVCGPLKASGNHIYFKKGLDPLKKEKIAEKILDAIEQESQKRKLSLSFPRVLEQEEVLVRQLHQRGYLKTLDLPRTYMNISWDSFDAYKQFIRKRSLNMKKNINKETNKNRKAGVTIEKVKDLNGQEKRLYALLNGNSLKYNKTSLPYPEDFLSRLKKNFADDLVIYRSLKKGRISGVTIMLRSGDIAHLPFVGVDHRLSKNDATYFNMVFYRPIKDAIDENIKRLNFGAALYDMKIRRGCNIQKTFFFHNPYHLVPKLTARLWFCFHCYWYLKKFPQLQHSDGD